MKITRLPRGNAQFPKERDPGDVVVLANGDIFTWSGGLWAMLGGRFLKPEVREWVLDYLKSGWPTPSDLRFDAGQMLELAGPNAEDRRWTDMVLANLEKYAESLMSERIS